MQILRTVDRDRIRGLRERGEFFWLSLIDPAPDDLDALADVVDMHPLAAEDSRQFGQRVKFEAYDDSALLVWYGAMPADDGVPRLVEVHCHLSAAALVTISREPLQAVAAARHAAAEHSDAREHPLYRVLGSVSVSILESLEGIDEAIDRLQDGLTQHATSAHRQQIFALRRRLSTLRRIVVPQRDIVIADRDELMDAVASAGADNGRHRLRDAADHLQHAVSLIDSYREQLQGLLDLYLAEASNDMNQVMKRLTFVATVFLPLTFLTGFFGMNFAWLVKAIEPTWTFWVFGIGLLVASAVAVGVWLRERG